MDKLLTGFLDKLKELKVKYPQMEVRLNYYIVRLEQSYREITEAEYYPEDKIKYFNALYQTAYDTYKGLIWR